jgi:putative SOS response-associated peptidase YedK
VSNLCSDEARRRGSGEPRPSLCPAIRPPRLGASASLGRSGCLWTRWTAERKIKEGEVKADLFGFLTINPSTEVGAIHPKAMPVILRTPEECETWMSAQALKMQRPLPDGALRIVAHGARQDAAD